VTLTVRRYEDRDRDAVRDLFIHVNRVLAPVLMREAFEGYIARSLVEEIDVIPEYYAARQGGFWIATDGEAVVGMFGLERAGSDAAELRRMYVAPEARRRGIARALLDRAETECRAAGYRRLILSTSEIQGAAIALYRASGYRLIREEIAITESNKTVGAGLRRFHFEKDLGSAA
jgi:GNAT superfamily N-acetyltransferase